MECPNCGNNVTDNSAYCPRCATRLPRDIEKTQIPTETRSEPDIRNGSTPAQTVPPALVGSIFDSFSGSICPWLREKPNTTLEWCYHETTMLFGESAIALVPRSSGSKFAAGLSFAGRMASTGIGGAVLVGLPLAVFSAALEQLTSSRGIESAQAAQPLFDSGNMLLLPRNSCTGYLFHYKEKGFFSGPQQDSLRFVGDIHHKTGVLPGYFSIDLDSPHLIQKLEERGYKVYEDSEVYEQMKFFKMPKPGDPGGAWMTPELVARKMRGETVLS